jgi:hypothetical protein
MQAGEKPESLRRLIAILALVDDIEQRHARRRAGHAQPVVERAPRAFAQFPLHDRQKVSVSYFQPWLECVSIAW